VRSAGSVVEYQIDAWFLKLMEDLRTVLTHRRFRNHQCQQSMIPAKLRRARLRSISLV
jgi:hypothetical protein